MFKAPDWKEAGQYPTPGKVSNSRFAWEFLRRNTAYQAAWSVYVARLKDAASGSDELLRYVECIDASAEHAASLCGPFQEPGPANHAASALFDQPGLWVTDDLGDGRKYREPLTRRMARDWGLEAMANPARDYALWCVRFLDRKGTSEPTSVGLAMLEKPFSEMTPPQSLRQSKWLILQIDLEQPLRVIEASTRWAIKSERNFRKSQGWIKPLEARGRSPAMLVHYLRILDAHALRVPAARIGEVLKPAHANAAPEYGRDKAIKAALRAAIKLRDGGYRLLPVLEDQGLPPMPTR